MDCKFGNENNEAMSIPYSEIENIPDRVSESEVLYILNTRDINWSYMNFFKEFTSLKDDIISKWLNVSVRTLHIPNFRREVLNGIKVKNRCFLKFSPQ